jgi:hypothetical protein
MAEEQNLTQVLDTIKKRADNAPQKISLGTLMHAFRKNGLTFLLLIPTAILLLPIGYIPGVSVLCGVLIALAAGQIIIGRREVWLPRTLKETSFHTKKITKAVKVARPYAKKIDKITYPRLEIFYHPTSQRLMAFLCLLLAIPIAIIGFVPLFPTVLGIPILLFSLGLFTKDGLVILAGFVAAAVAIMAFPFMLAFLA